MTILTSTPEIAAAAGRFPWALRARVSVLVLSTMLAGCTVGPSFKRPIVEAPPGWSSWQGGDVSLRDAEMRGNQAPVSERWYETFEDATLNALQIRARTANPDLRTAALHFAQSRAQRQTAAAQRGPQVNAEAGASRQRESERGAITRLLGAIAPANSGPLVQVLSDPYNLYQAGFDASWELDLWGRVRRSVEAADADLAASSAALDGVRIGIAAEVARNYFELRAVQEQLRLARADLAAAEEYLELVQARADGGVASDLDATRQRALLAELAARLPQLLDQEARSINLLSLLLGERPGALHAELNSGADTSVRRLLPDLALGLPSELARRRPDIRLAEAKLHSATAAIGIAVADLYPRITLGGKFGLESISSRDLVEWGSRRWTIGPSLEIPIFDMGRRRSVVTLRKLQEQEAAVAYQRTVLQAWHEIDTALSAYAAERQRNAQLAKREKESRDAYELAHVRSQNGLTSSLDELDARRAVLSAQRDYAGSNVQMAIGLVAIYKALGGGALDERSASQLPP
jgi:NodT family efflux transporter outer membrane factor (OMF) lipoprotein